MSFDAFSRRPQAPFPRSVLSLSSLLRNLYVSSGFRQSISKTPAPSSGSSSMTLPSASSSVSSKGGKRSVFSFLFSSFSSAPPLLQSLRVLRELLKRSPGGGSTSSCRRPDIRSFNYALATAARHRPTAGRRLLPPTRLTSGAAPLSSSSSSPSPPLVLPPPPYASTTAFSSSSSFKPSDSFSAFRLQSMQSEEEKTDEEGDMEAEGALAAEWILRYLAGYRGLVKPNSVTLTMALQAFRNVGRKLH